MSQNSSTSNYDEEVFEGDEENNESFNEKISENEKNTVSQKENKNVKHDELNIQLNSNNKNKNKTTSNKNKVQTAEETNGKETNQKKRKKKENATKVAKKKKLEESNEDSFVDVNNYFDLETNEKLKETFKGYGFVILGKKHDFKFKEEVLTTKQTNVIDLIKSAGGTYVKNASKNTDFYIISKDDFNLKDSEKCPEHLTKALGFPNISFVSLNFILYFIEKNYTPLKLPEIEEEIKEYIFLKQKKPRNKKKEEGDYILLNNCEITIDSHKFNIDDIYFFLKY